MATVSIFMQVYDNAPPYLFLDRLICQWRKAEEEVRETCGLPSVGDPYPGCWHFTRGHTPSPVPPTFPTPDVAVVVNAAQDDGGGETRQRRKLLRDNQAAHDVLMQNSLSNTTTKKILLDDINFRDADWTDEQWAEWIESLSSESKREGRNLLEYDSLSYHNYQFLIDVKTEVCRVCPIHASGRQPALFFLIARFCSTTSDTPAQAQSLRAMDHSLHRHEDSATIGVC